MTRQHQIIKKTPFHYEIKHLISVQNVSLDKNSKDL